MMDELKGMISIYEKFSRDRDLTYEERNEKLEAIERLWTTKYQDWKHITFVEYDLGLEIIKRVRELMLLEDVVELWKNANGGKLK